MLLCHSPVGELSLTRKHWKKMRCRCGNCISIPLQCSCCWRAWTVTLTLFLCGARLHQSVNLICLWVQPACPYGTTCSRRLHPPRSPSPGMTQSVMQHIWWGTQKTMELKRGLDLPFSYVMSEWCLFLCFQKSQIKEYEKRRVKKGVFFHKLLVTSKLLQWKNCYMMLCQ